MLPTLWGCIMASTVTSIQSSESFHSVGDFGWIWRWKHKTKWHQLPSEQKFQILSNLSQQYRAVPTQPPSEQREMFVALKFIQSFSTFDVKRSLAFHVHDLDVPKVKALLRAQLGPTRIATTSHPLPPATPAFISPEHRAVLALLVPRLGFAWGGCT